MQVVQAPSEIWRLLQKLAGVFWLRLHVHALNHYVMRWTMARGRHISKASHGMNQDSCGCSINSRTKQTSS